MRKLVIITMFTLTCLSVFGQNLADDFDSTAAYKAAESAVQDTLVDKLFKVYKDAVGNWRELANFVEKFEDEQREDAVWLVRTMPHLDRMLATEDILAEHLEYSWKAREEAPWDIPEDMFRPYLLSYRISYEPVTSWRQLFWDKFSADAFDKGNIRDAAKMVNQWVYENIDTAGYDFFGGMQSPDQTYRSGRGTSRERSALTTAILMSLGIPVRNTMVRTTRGEGSGMSWVEVFDSETEEWVPLYPRDPEKFGDKGFPAEKFPGGMTVVSASGGFDYNLITPEYAPTGYLSAQFYRGEEPADDWKHFAITVLGGGAYWPLDEIGAQADSNGLFEIELAEGEYVLQNGMRDNTGSIWVQTQPFAIAEGETTSLEIDVDAPEYIGAPTEKGKFPEFTLSDTKGKPFSHNRVKHKKPLVLFFFDPEGEPSIRAFPMIENAVAEYADSVRFIYVWVKTDDGEIPETERRVLIDKNGALTMLLKGADDMTELKNNYLPLVLFSSGDDLSYEVISEGYDTNLENNLTQTIQQWLNERQSQ